MSAPRNPVARLLLVAALYALIARGVMPSAVLAGTIVPVWAPAGVGLLALLRWDARVWPGLWAGAFVASVLGVAHPGAAAIAATGATSAGLMAAAVWRATVRGPVLRRIHHVPPLALCAVVSGTVSAVFGVTALALQGDVAWGAVPSAGAVWAFGDALGVLLVVPAWLLRDRVGRRRLLRLALTAGPLAGIAVLVFCGPDAPLWLLIGPAIVLPVCEGVPGAVAASAVLSGIAIWATAGGLGPFGDPAPAMLEAQLFALTTTVALLAVAALTEERDAGLARARRLGEEDAALRRVATAVAGTGSLEEISRLAAEELLDLLGLDAGVVVRYEGDRVEVLASAARDGLEIPGAGARLAIAPGGAVDRLRRSAAPERFDERGRTLSMPPFCQRVAAPVLADGAVWGALIGVTRSEADLPGGTEERIGRFAELVGIAIMNVAARARLVDQATTDPLTGLVNHRAFHERLREEVALARRHGGALSLAVFDVDRFKVVNDALGHLAGDRVLAETARRLRAAAREGEVVARVGGDELALLMPGSRAQDAVRAAERVRAAVAAEPFGEAGTLTLSAGVCDLEQGRSAEELLQLADGALYWCKAHGRDQVVRYDPSVVQELSAAERAERLERSRALAAVRALAGAIDAKDPATIRHSERVADLAAALAEVSGWPHARVARLHDAGLVHDVGKIGVPDAILAKPGRLTDDEYAVIKRHAELGARIAGEVLDPEQVRWVRGHHERHDGRGYPDGLAGDAICDGARLLALADAWDAMTGARVYSAPMPFAEALAECRRHAGRQFAPESVAALERLAAAGLLGEPLALTA